MDHKMMEKMLAKKKGGMDPLEQHAKMGVVKAMRDMASKAMDNKLAGLKKVSVASNTSEGLSHGLDKAKELLAQTHNPEPEMEDNEAMDSIDNHSDEAETESEGGDTHGLELGDSEAPEHEAMETPGMEAAEHMPEEQHEVHGHIPMHDGMHDDMSEDEIDAKLAHLSALKAKKAKK